MNVFPPLGRVIGDVDPSSFGDPIREIGMFHSCKTPTEARAVLREEVEVEVGAMLDVLAGFDAFDVIELLRLREYPPVRDPRVVVSDGTAMPIEIVCAILLSRGSRKPAVASHNVKQPHEVIPELHDRCGRLSRLSTYRTLMESRLSDDPLSRLAGEFQLAVSSIRNVQYEHIRDRHDETLFETAMARELMQAKLGYTFADVTKIRSALSSLASKRMTALRDLTGDLMMEHRDIDPADLPLDVKEQFDKAMTSFMFLPADRAAMTPKDIANEAGLTTEVVTTVLVSFAQTFDTTKSAGDRVYDLLVGRNPFLMSPLVADDEGNYVLTSNEIGLDTLRRILERALSHDERNMKRYDQKGRQGVSESLAAEYVAQIMGKRATLTGYYYYVGKDKSDYAADVDQHCTNLNATAERVEGDSLFVIDDVALIVEVKGKSIADQARRGDLRRLTNDLKATIGDGARQADRLSQLIQKNGGMWNAAKERLDLSHINEVRTLVVLLDDVGPLGTNLADLEAAQIIQTEQTPLVLSIHDLAVIAEIGERPSEFLLYLRRRTDSPVKTNYRAVDELDLYMLFLSADLYVEDDPDALKKQHPTAPPVTNHQRRLREASAVGTLVSDNCAELNAWMSREHIPESLPAPTKPMIAATPALLQLIDRSRAMNAPGWLRCGADLLGLSRLGQDRVVSSVRTTRQAAKRDGNYHDAAMSWAGLFGHPALFIACRGTTLGPDHARTRLATYATAKSAQLGVDRAYLWLVDTTGSIEGTGYLGNVISLPPRSGEAATIGLQPVGDGARKVPPSAKRATIRMQSGRKNKR